MVFGVFCAAYYLAICIYLGRWDSKFPRIWPVFGAVSVLIAIYGGGAPECLKAGARAAGLLFLLLFAVVEVLILFGMRSGKGGRAADYVIVLGAKVDGVNLTDALRQRLDRALIYLREHPEAKVIVSGGQGPGEQMTEACAMASYLEKSGIAWQRILKEEDSTTTRENLIFSGRILREDSGLADLEDAEIGLVTNNFHMYRAVHIAGQVGYRSVTALAAPTTPVMFVNYMTREFFGVLKMWVQRNQRE